MPACIVPVLKEEIVFISFYITPQWMPGQRMTEWAQTVSNTAHVSVRRDWAIRSTMATGVCRTHAVDPHRFIRQLQWFLRRLSNTLRLLWDIFVNFQQHSLDAWVETTISPYFVQKLCNFIWELQQPSGWCLAIYPVQQRTLNLLTSVDKTQTFT